MEFKYTIGHKKQKKLFENITQNQKLGHAYVFVGPEHVGKTTLALELSTLLGANEVLDVILYDKEDGITIGEAREIQNRLSLTPAGKLKVAIISYAERMTLESANSLLKALEEPSQKSLLILTAVNFHSLLPTVASRLQRINFGLGAQEEVAGALKEFNLNEEQLAEIIAFADGRIGLAKKIAMDQETLDFFRESQTVYEVLESGTSGQKLEMVEKLLSKESETVRNFLEFAMFSWTRNLKNQSLGQKIMAAYKDLEYNLNMRLILDNLFLV